jgi:hypothetical protein
MKKTILHQCIEAVFRIPLGTSKINRLQISFGALQLVGDQMVTT